MLKQIYCENCEAHIGMIDIELGYGTKYTRPGFSVLCCDCAIDFMADGVLQAEMEAVQDEADCGN